MVEPDAFTVGQDPSRHRGSVVLRTEVFECPVRAPDRQGVRGAAADGAAGDQQVLRHGHRAGAQHDRVLRPPGPPGLRDLMAQSHSTTQRIGASTPTARRSSTQWRRREDHRYRSRPPAASCSGRDPRGDDRGPPRPRSARAPRLAGLDLAVTVLDQRKAGFAAAAIDEEAAKIAIAFRRERLPGRASAGGGVRLAAAHRPGVAVRGEQLRGGQVAGARSTCCSGTPIPPGWPPRCTATWC